MEIEDVDKKAKDLIKRLEKTKKEAEEFVSECEKILAGGHEEDGTPLTEERREFFRDAIRTLKGL
jgi:hypothetical protein